MGVYSNSRFFNESFIDAPEPDLSYRGTSGANRIISEMVENDMAFFDAIIVNDIQEAYLTNAVNEGATDLLPQITAIQEATGGGIFSKIGEFLKNIWKKISGLIMSFVNKVTGSLTSDNKKLVKKFEKQINSKEDVIKKMEFKWSDVKKDNSFPFKEPIMNNGKADYGDEKNKLWEMVDDVLTLHYDNDKNKGGVISQLASNTEALMRKVEDTNFNYHVYTNYIENNAPINSSELAKACHDYWFKEEETKRNAFHQYSSEIKSVLNNSKQQISDLEKNKRSIDDWFKKEIKECEKIAKESGVKDTDMSYAHKRMDTGEITGTYTGDTAKSRLNDNEKKFTVDGVEKNRGQVINKAANTLKNYYSKLQTCVTELLNQQMSAVQFYIKQCRRVWIQAASYSANHESALVDAIGESADLETDQLFAMFD